MCNSLPAIPIFSKTQNLHALIGALLSHLIPSQSADRSQLAERDTAKINVEPIIKLAIYIGQKYLYQVSAML